VTAVALVADDGARIDLDVRRWRGEPDGVEASLLSWLPDPVLDVGCGPGRVATALCAAGRVALGIDPSPAATREAARRGAPVLQRSVFGPLPGEGRWASALLLDGNVGIGGDPIGLLARIAELLRPGGVVVAEVEPAGGVRPLVVRVDAGGEVGPPFPWATLGADAWAATASAAGLAAMPVFAIGSRTFAAAVRPP